MNTDSVYVNRKAARSAATRAALVAAARPLFATRGYAAVGTEEIVRAAGVTRGALYHQFADKRALFRAVFEDVEREMIESVVAGAASQEGPLDELRAGFLGWLDRSMDPEVQRIVLLDAPAVLGWEAWREIGEAGALGIVAATLGAAMEAGAIAVQPQRALAHVLIGALDEAALYVARASDRDGARAEMEMVLGRLVDGLALIER
jgi:AcrR family transcriptional regulator